MHFAGLGPFICECLLHLLFLTSDAFYEGRHLGKQLFFVLELTREGLLAEDVLGY
jgi:hypothetical protein